MWNNNKSLGKVKIDVSMTSGNDKNEKNHKKVQHRGENFVNSSTKSFDTNTDINNWILIMDSSTVKHVTNYHVKWRTAGFLLRAFQV